MPKRTPLIALGATVAAAGAAALSPLGADLRPAPADAQSTTTQARPSTAPAREREPLGQREKQAEAALAKALGKSTAAVHAARRTVLEARLQEQRAADRITTEQGEAILRAFDVYVPVGPLAGGGPGGFGGPGGGPGRRPRGERPEGERPSREQRQERREQRREQRGERREERRDDQEAALAKALGVSVTDLREARAEVLDAKLAEAQKAGRITEAQRKAAVEAAKTGERPAGLGRRGGVGPGGHGPGGPGRFGPVGPGGLDRDDG